MCPTLTGVGLPVTKGLVPIRESSQDSGWSLQQNQERSASANVPPFASQHHSLSPLGTVASGLSVSLPHVPIINPLPSHSFVEL